ncbi:hypothetical protein L1987_12112 [Smallanthus sonchifolius]|uniref:Uncharacterized protein n=1 Tax=Smallanthus sonchifolius TaxID=185202 RepID=A0ACB9JEF0_9ASTR|nr:hypothetical protein L1987_12112 [Smallanthus sonchifolius]
MERSPAVGNTVLAFINWEEVCYTNHRGRKEVRFYLKRRCGTYDLAVVGKERKLGHRTMTSSSSSYRYRYANRDKSLFLSLNLPSKLRSRQAVIDCLDSIVSLSDGSFPLPPQPVNGVLGSGYTLRLNSEKIKDVHLHKTGRHTTEFVWVGSAWTCRKKRKHFGAYTRSGVKISVQDFVYVLAEGSKRLVAYINDLYEDSRGNRIAVVQWFHKIDELGLELPCTYNDKEIFFSLCLQDLSIECIDGLATVLGPQQYENILKSSAAQTILDCAFVCQNQFENEVIKPFDLTQVKGYWNQNILKFLSTDCISIRPKKRLRKLVDNEYSLGSEIEILSQDSGIRGVWFKAVVIKKHKDKLKVWYQDIKDAADESINLEEWILSSRVAIADELGIRHGGRITIRPTRLANKIDVHSIDVGCIVDAWLHDGWWEGIVVHKESDDRIDVYFPGEKDRSVFGCKDLRYSQEWLGDSWKKMEDRPDLLGLISCSTKTNLEATKSNDNVSSLSSEENRDFEVDLLASLTWNWSTKKRHSRHLCKNNNLVAVGRRKRDSYPMPVCKFTCARVASPLTRLVMSR